MRKPENKLEHCANCGYEFKDENNYCPSCGQKNHELKIPFKRLMVEIAENTLDLDSKAYRTIKYLLLKPGYLSSEFNSGKRVKYIPPIRLYLLISFVFFLLLSILSGIGTSANNPESTGKKTTSTVSYRNLSTLELAGLTKTQVDSLMEAKKIPRTMFNKMIIYRLHKIANSASADFKQSLMKNISYMMFVLMPVFAIFIYLFNRKRINYYIESLVLSIHFHSFVFLFFVIVLVIVFFVKQPLIYLTWIVVPPVYMVIMFKKYFGQGIAITLTKTLFINVFYIASFILLLALTLIVSVILV